MFKPNPAKAARSIINGVYPDGFLVDVDDPITRRRPREFTDRDNRLIVDCLVRRQMSITGTVRALRLSCSRIGLLHHLNRFKLVQFIKR